MSDRIAQRSIPAIGTGGRRWWMRNVCAMLYVFFFFLIDYQFRIIMR